jgi:hypothetical protein
VAAQIKSMTDRDLARLWSQYVKELAVLLVLAEGGHPPQEVVARMQELVQRELLLLYMRCAAPARRRCPDSSMTPARNLIAACSSSILPALACPSRAV